MQKILVQNVPHEWEPHLSFATEGRVRSKYHIDGDHEFLIEFLLVLGQVPIFLTFTTYNETDEICKLLKSLNIKYSRAVLKDTVLTSTPEGGVLEYPTPCFSAIVQSYNQLRVLIEELYWLPESNMFFSISFSNNLILKSEKINDFRGKDTEISIPTFVMNDKSTFIVICHDGNGFFFYSNEDKFNSIEELQKIILNNYVLEVAL